MSDPPHSAPKERGRFFGILIAGGAIVSIGLPFLVRSILLDRAVVEAVWTLSEISDALPKSPLPGDDGEFSPLFPLWPGDVEGGPVATPDSTAGPPASDTNAAKSKKQRALYRPVIGPPPFSARASTSLVLSWVESRLVPTGVTRPPYGEIPAGIELKGVSGLGVGLMDGDRLVTVAGAPVDSRGLVVGAVLAARSRQAPTIQATLVRMTKKGPVTFSVVVEQPYLQPESQPELEDDPGGSNVEDQKTGISPRKVELRTPGL
jgi:hypothetical protein